MRSSFTKIFGVLALFLVPGALVAQQPGLNPAELPPEAREAFTELQQIQSELAPIQQAALQDPAIQSAQQALGAQLQEAMLEVDPRTPDHIAQLEALAAEAQTAQAEQDQQRFAEILAEAQQIERDLQSAQTAALQDPAIQPQVEGFQAQLQEKMVEVDPEAERLIQRAEELDQRLAVLLGSAR